MKCQKLRRLMNTTIMNDTYVQMLKKSYMKAFKANFESCVKLSFG